MANNAIKLGDLIHLHWLAGSSIDEVTERLPKNHELWSYDQLKKHVTETMNALDMAYEAVSILTAQGFKPNE